MTSTSSNELIILSWNILHIMHEWNYVGPDSLVIKKYPDEKNRMMVIIDFIKNIYDKNNACVINLQEVPGDYLISLRELFGDKVIFNTYDRIPKPRRPEADIYINKSESLVSIVKGVDIISSNFELLETGKGYIHLNLVYLDQNFNIFNAHMPFKYKNTINISELENVFIVGDFNAGVEESCSIFTGFHNIDNDDIEYTFISWRDETVKKDMLDHILTNVSSHNKQYIIYNDLSDHMPVYTIITK